jgi:predicted transcriptional regulator
MSNKQLWTDYSLIIRSKQRKEVIVVMDRPMTVTEIKNKLEISLSDTSRVLRRFSKEGLARCINSNDHLGRIYELTERGIKIKQQIDIDNSP